MRVIDFADGFTTSSAPGAGTVSTTQFADYATDAAFVAAKGAAAEDGDAYYNTTYDAVRVYQNGAWHFLKTAALLTFATDADYVTAKGSAAAVGDIYVNTTDGLIHFHDGTRWVVAGRPEPTFSIADNQGAAADVTGLLFSSASYRGALIRYEITRGSGAGEKRSVGTLALVYRANGAAWEIAGEDFFGDNHGMTFSVTAAGQVQYTSDASGTGTMKFHTETFNA